MSSNTAIATPNPLLKHFPKNISMLSPTAATSNRLSDITSGTILCHNPIPSPYRKKPFLLFIGGEGSWLTYFINTKLFLIQTNFLINAKFHILWQTSNFIANFTFYRKFNIFSHNSNYLANFKIFFAN